MGFFEVFAGALAAFYALIPSYGLAIILLTIATRVLLLPLSIKQTKSMREMQVIQPEVKKIQTKHKADPQKRNEEMMKLYKEHGVNPFGGCLPLVMQMPVFIGLYQVVRYNLKYMGYEVSEAAANGFALADHATGGLLGTLADSKLAQDLLHLGSRETVNQFLPGVRLDCSLTEAWRGVSSVTVDASCGGSSPILAVMPYVLMIAFMGFTTYYQQRQMMAGRGANDQQAQQMQMVGRIMPFILVVFGLQFPAGVLVYWIATNVWTIVQQRIILAKFGPMPGSTAAPKKTGKKTGKEADKPEAKSAKSTAKSAKPAAKKPKATTKNASKAGTKKSTTGRASSDGQASGASSKAQDSQEPSDSQSGNGSTQASSGAGAGRKKRRR